MIGDSHKILLLNKPYILLPICQSDKTVTLQVKVEDKDMH